MFIHRFILHRFLFVVLLSIGLAAMSVSARSQSPAFLSVIDDLPLMPGFVEDVEGALQFEAANGRIAETTATGDVAADAVLAFYTLTLPQLGWQLETPTHYRREGEELIIDVAELEANRNSVQVHFRLFPSEEK